MTCHRQTLDYRWVQYARLGLMLLAGWRLRHAEEWKSIFVAVSGMLLLPPTSLLIHMAYWFLFSWVSIAVILNPLLIYLLLAPVLKQEAAGGSRPAESVV